MTTRNQSLPCNEVQIAAWARLDGEPAALTPAQVEEHVAACDACRAALASLTALHARLNRVDYDDVDVDLWPLIHQRLARNAPRHAMRESWAIVGLAVLLGAWRLAQLLVELPAPVVNSVVPLVLIVLVLRQLTGDPFAIRVGSQQLQREGTS